MLPVQFTFWGIYWLECILSCPHISPIHIYIYHRMIGFGCYATLTLVVESSINCRWNVQVSGVLLVLLLLLPPRLLCSLSLARLLATPQFSKMTSWNTHWNTQKKRNTTLQYTWCLCWMETLSNMINMWVDCHKLATSRTRVSQRNLKKTVPLLWIFQNLWGVISNKLWIGPILYWSLPKFHKSIHFWSIQWAPESWHLLLLLKDLHIQFRNLLSDDHPAEFHPPFPIDRILPESFLAFPARSDMTRYGKITSLYGCPSKWQHRWVRALNYPAESNQTFSSRQVGSFPIWWSLLLHLVKFVFSLFYLRTDGLCFWLLSSKSRATMGRKLKKLYVKKNDWCQNHSLSIEKSMYITITHGQNHQGS